MARVTPVNKPITIRLLEKDSLIIVPPGQQFVSVGDVFRLIDVSASDAIAWRDGWIVLNGVDMEEVLQLVGRWYDVEISGDSLNERQVYGLI